MLEQLSPTLSPELKTTLAGLEGLISEEVGLTLARLAELVLPHQAIVEVGSYKGKSTCYLAAGARARPEAHPGSHVYAVDPWDLPANAGGRFGFDQKATREAFHRQLKVAGVEDVVAPIQKFSVQAAREWTGPQIGLLYIDGSHTERDVRNDFEWWSQHLQSHAFVVFDDYGTERNPGVAIVVHEIIQRHRGSWTFEPAPLAIGRAAWN